MIRACDHEGTRMELGRQPALWCRRCGALYVDGQWVTPALRVPDSAAIRDRDAMCETLTTVQARCTELLEQVRALTAWEDVDDEWTQAIANAHPARSGSHATYAVAMRMVGHRHGKFALVSLVNWLLVRLARGGEMTGGAPAPSPTRGGPP